MKKVIIIITILISIFTINVNAEEMAYYINIDHVDYVLTYNNTSVDQTQGSMLARPLKVEPGTQFDWTFRPWIDYTNLQWTTFNAPNIMEYWGYNYDSKKLWDNTLNWFGPMYVGPGHYNGNPQENLVITDNQIQYIYLRFCISDPQNLKKTGTSSNETQGSATYLGTYARQRLIDMGQFGNTLGGTCNMVYIDPNTGVATTIPGWQSTMVFQVNGWKSPGDSALTRYSHGIRTGFKNNSTNPIYIALYPNTDKNQPIHLATSEDETAFLLTEQQNIGEALKDGITLLEEYDISWQAKQNVDQTNENAYNSQEQSLLNSANNMNLNNLNLTIDTNGNNSVWQIATSILNSNAKILTLMISSLTIAIIRMIGGR